MRRFFFDPKRRDGDNVTLSEEESRHILKVLRLQPGSEVELLDGLGAVYRAIITATGRRAEARIEEIIASNEGSGRSLWVGQGILKGEKMDTVVQKCTELGVARMTPFRSSRCQGKLNAAQNRKKHERWQRIGVAACKQCFRPTLMQLDMPAGYDEFLVENSGAGEVLRLLFWEEEQDVHLHDIEDIRESGAIAILLGPEGGFTREEVELARDQGWRTVSLGDRILRAETATLTAVSIVQFLSGNL